MTWFKFKRKPNKASPVVLIATSRLRFVERPGLRVGMASIILQQWYARIPQECSIHRVLDALIAEPQPSEGEWHDVSVGVE